MLGESYIKVTKKGVKMCFQKTITAKMAAIILKVIVKTST